MSTAGKVLTVFIAMLALIWVLLASTVAEYNRNGTKAIEDLKKQVAQLDVQVTKAQTELRDFIDQAYQERLVTQNELTGLQARLSEVEKTRALVLETDSRVKFQLKGMADTVNKAKANSQQRLTEQEAETKARDDAEKLVEQLKGENNQLLGELTSQRDKFRTTRETNKELADRLRKGDRPTTRTARPVSYVP
jgi:chromosome segregation ATPase